MHKLFKLRHRSVLGVDIGSTSVNILEITQKQSQYWVKSYGHWIYPADVVENGVIKDIQTLGFGIKKLLVTSKSMAKEAILAVPDTLTISKIIQVHSSLDERDIEESVSIEAGKFKPNAAQNMYFDYNVHRSSTDVTLFDIPMIATRAESIIGRVDALHLSGLKVNIVEIESSAIQRVVRFLLSQHTIAIFYTDITRPNLYVFQDKTLIFAHQDSIEENPFENTLLSSDQFESVGLPLKRSLNLFLSNHPDTTLDQLLISGNLATIPNLSRCLQDVWNIPTSILNPLKNMRFVSDINQQAILHHAPMLLIACGLALRATYE